MDYQANTQANIKLNNQKIMLDLLIKEGPLSRADIAKRIGSSKPTVSKNVDELFKDKKLIESGKADNLVGKKGILIDINEKYQYILAIDLSKNRFRLVLANLRHEWLYNQNEESLKVMDNPVQIIEMFIDSNHIDVDQIGQIVIAYPGVVGHNEDFYLTNIQHKKTILDQIKPYLETRIKKPIVVKNDLNLAVLAEKTFGQFRAEKNLCLISGDVGVGLGIIINHRLYEGDRNAAGEIGFVLPVQHSDGHYFTLEERIGRDALLERYKQRSGKPVSYGELKKLVESDEHNAVELYQDTVKDLCVAVTNVASILDIRTVIATGCLFQLKSTMFEDLNNLLEEMTPFETKLYETSLDKKALKGAVIEGVERVIDNMVTL